MNNERTRRLNQRPDTDGPVVYWMSREQRVRDNWALTAASAMAKDRRRPLVVAFTLAPSFLGATWRQYNFMLRGLREVQRDVEQMNVPFFLLQGPPIATMPAFVRSIGAGAVVTDFTPLRVGREWREAVANAIEIPVFEVDARNIVPCWVASNKAEVGARTLRPKILKLLDRFLDEYPPLSVQDPGHGIEAPPIDWKAVEDWLAVDRSVGPYRMVDPGEDAARAALDGFLDRIDRYDVDRNNPAVDAQSGLSAYLHFGQISAQRIAQEVIRRAGSTPSAGAFLEELIVRRELSDNFCLYRPDYDTTECFPTWAKQTLEKHLVDRRQYLYTRDEFEDAKTHDPLWNAAQVEMVERGKMHGYLRMYWAKKILEWSETSDEAMATAIYLNDRYQLDGRESNGYAGIAWSMGGVHDRPWPERPIYGTVRYMSYNGAKAKFDVDAYVRRVTGRGQESLF